VSFIRIPGERSCLRVWRLQRDWVPSRCAYAAETVDGSTRVEVGWEWLVAGSECADGKTFLTSKEAKNCHEGPPRRRRDEGIGEEEKLTAASYQPHAISYATSSSTLMRSDLRT
jgi:hypothetical protein